MKFNPDRIKIEHNKRFSENVKKQERYLEIVKRNKESYMPNEEDFIGFYNEEEVRSDISYKERLRETFTYKKEYYEDENSEVLERMKRISDIYEGVIVEQAEQNAWFGDCVNFYPTSEYDDFVHGVDGVAEFVDENQEENDHIAMSFDVVFSKHAERVVQKLDKTRKLIDRGKLAEVKYFENNQGKKKRIFAPRIILGSRLVSAESLIDLWGSRVENRNAQLANHPIQIKLLLETYLQSFHFAKYAQEIGNDEIALAYAKVSNKITDIINNEKKELLREHFSNVSEDIVFETIKDYCNKAEL